MEPKKIKREYINIYLLAIILIVFGLIKIFDDPGKNYALIYLGIATILWGITVQIRYYNIIDIPKISRNTKKSWTIEAPYNIKCFFKERNCENGDIEIWTLLHFLLYFVAGIFFPNRYLFFLIISVLCEIYELVITSYSSKIILDPIFNMLGYTIGNIIGSNYNSKLGLKSF